ncbi:uncharacterized protein L201_004041 [Kwoniella dendrophila CBS 6074]|uniref:Transcription initiation factor TFIID subunit 13 n=1 Tax=Kwoniella dendrophila CBS 6074 TaxID=1295534 RepID=A0AAX4JW75_9TREE
MSQFPNGFNPQAFLAQAQARPNMNLNNSNINATGSPNPNINTPSPMMGSIRPSALQNFNSPAASPTPNRPHQFNASQLASLTDFHQRQQALLAVQQAQAQQRAQGQVPGQGQSAQNLQAMQQILQQRIQVQQQNALQQFLQSNNQSITPSQLQNPIQASQLQLGHQTITPQTLQQSIPINQNSAFNPALLNAAKIAQNTISSSQLTMNPNLTSLSPPQPVNGLPSASIPLTQTFNLVPGATASATVSAKVDDQPASDKKDKDKEDGTEKKEEKKDEKEKKKKPAKKKKEKKEDDQEKEKEVNKAEKDADRPEANKEKPKKKKKDKSKEENKDIEKDKDKDKDKGGGEDKDKDKDKTKEKGKEKDKTDSTAATPTADKPVKPKKPRTEEEKAKRAEARRRKVAADKAAKAAAEAAAAAQNGDPDAGVFSAAPSTSTDKDVTTSVTGKDGKKDDKSKDPLKDKEDKDTATKSTEVRAVDPKTTASATATATESRSRRQEGMRGSMRHEIARLMYGAGDVPEPDIDTVDYMEDMVVEFLADLCRPIPPLRPTPSSAPLPVPLSFEVIRHRLTTPSYLKYLERFDHMVYMSEILKQHRRIANPNLNDLVETVGNDYLGLDDQQNGSASNNKRSGGEDDGGRNRKRGRPINNNDRMLKEKGEKRKPGPQKGWKLNRDRDPNSIQPRSNSNASSLTSSQLAQKRKYQKKPGQSTTPGPFNGISNGVKREGSVNI